MQPNITEKTCAIIVTYNRKELLTRCLDSVINQSFPPQKIIIIDNFSTDATYEYLVSNNYLDNEKIQYTRLDRNTGGAGGFYEGLLLASKAGFDYFWTMDDDGCPVNDCLENLVSFVNEYDFISPLVVSEHNNDLLSFGINGEKLVSNVVNKNIELIEGVANPFNGILLTKRLVDTIGLPKKDMFIWGDENEYQSRAKRFGMKICTVLKARHIHPENRIKSKIIFNKIKINLPDGKLRRYCYFRNYTYILSKYYGKKELLKWYIKYISLFIYYGDFSGVLFFLKASYHGITNDFSHHEEYF